MKIQQVMRQFFSCTLGVLLWMCSLTFSVQSVVALTPKDQKGVITLKAPGIEYLSPTRFTPLSLEDAPEEIEYRLSILPYEEDRQEEMYIVLPTLGLVSPVVFVPE